MRKRPGGRGGRNTITDLERDDRALIEALKAELIEARNQAETRSIHNARLRSERDVAMEEVERLNGVTEALEKTVKDLIAQHREAKDEVERERAKLKSECTGCEKTARLEDAVARLTRESAGAFVTWLNSRPWTDRDIEDELGDFRADLNGGAPK